jgi:hypothetical protein
VLLFTLSDGWLPEVNGLERGKVIGLAGLQALPCKHCQAGRPSYPLNRIRDYCFFSEDFFDTGNSGFGDFAEKYHPRTDF